MRAGEEGGHRIKDGWMVSHEFEQIREIVKGKQAWCAAVYGLSKTQTTATEHWTSMEKNTE